MESNKIRVSCAAPSGIINAGRLKKCGTGWINKSKVDVTAEATFAVGHSLMLKREDVEFDFGSKRFKLSVEEIVE